AIINMGDLEGPPIPPDARGAPGSPGPPLDRLATADPRPGCDYETARPGVRARASAGSAATGAATARAAARRSRPRARWTATTIWLQRPARPAPIACGMRIGR